MTTRAARRIANAMIAATVLLQLASTSLELSSRAVGRDRGEAFYLIVSVLAAATYLLIGRTIVTRHPTNTIGWLLMSIPLIATFAFANGDYAVAALVDTDRTLPFGMASAWIDRWLLVPVLSLFIPLFLLFPDGRLPSGSRRWRWVLVVTIAAPALATVAFAVTPGLLTGAMEDLGPAGITNPLGIERAGALIETLGLVAGFTTLGTAVAALVALVARFRQATPEVRQQIRWLALVGVAFFVELGLAVLGSANDNDVGGDVLFVLMFVTLVLGIPAACGVAILKYRLYDLDIVVRKAVVAAILAGFIGLVYVTIVSGLGALVGSERDSVLSFAAAAVLAIAFQPVRERARRIADRLVYGQRATPYEVLSEFSERAGEAFSIDEVLPRMAELVGRGVTAENATVWLRVGAELRPKAAWPAGELAAAVAMQGDALPVLGQHAVEVRHRGELLGAIGVTMPPSEPLDPSKDRLVRDLAAQAGLVLRNTNLVEELRASRQRMVAAQDEERRKLERNLHDGAQQQLVSLQVQLRLAENLAGADPDGELRLIQRLHESAAGALEDLRDLARGIYPPLLADQGLAAALGAQARRSSIPVEVEPDGIGRYEREVESAVYFCALEALNNVAKYANATRATVRLAESAEGVTFEVADDGQGFDTNQTRYGTGLQGMADRLDAIGGSLTVQSAPGKGTTVRGAVRARSSGGAP